MKEEEILYKKREQEIDELFKRTEWIFEDEKMDVAPRKKREIYLPDGIDVLKTSSMLDIQVDWRKNVTLKSLRPFIFFSVVWNLAILFIVAASVTSGSWAVVPGAGIHIAVGVGMLYHTLSLIFNKSVMTINDEQIEIKHSPLFSFTRRDRRIKIKDVQQLYIRRERNGSVNGVPTYQYALYVLDNKNKRTRLMRGLNHETLLFLEQEVERFIEIPDKRVNDEVRAT